MICIFYFLEVPNPILRGWRNFYRNAVSSRTFSYVDHKVFRMLIK
ncbi:hypothetical protein GNE08_29670 (plasmid) [Trichormus variabilis ARAD]|uniref:Group II intron maturase-specific domain-containing protein n=1 Tax=Trichormus variabilis N2B TaxID=2681315 RepID=A0ABR6SHX0_ANAVA|nr:hypothetical protein [Trichormus variabilis ARAD]MBC1259628.1 hypothetical protein [Trichormus variabilis V5]MBC1271132.1 hypothetical protein [Trichormus variabilis FSR]MBC1305853.1 hypothetical protein [Trichormus variabilis N2B]MBC1314894.1 hypothetical protein [Trichormus variabilis PNB]MBC1330151.1 hypothetical protein [Trichormus variabilis 9RC]MBD2383328.1 hypothetical protein [Trichormus variabilis FACHB-319]QFZ12175.1 hypothetical protein EH233_09220 [Anabaena sp. YBS01]QHD83739